MAGRGGAGTGAIWDLNLPVVLSPEAEREFDAAADWYELQGGLGVQFVAQVREVVARIGQMPELHPVVYRDVRSDAPWSAGFATISTLRFKRIGWR
jgi:hypothetical protein